jgi:hypothetical protein
MRNRHNACNKLEVHSTRFTYHSRSLHTQIKNMKNILITSLFTLILATSPAYSQSIEIEADRNNRNIVEVTPFNLVYHGYQGYFSELGIPSNGAFLQAIKFGKITAKDLVKAAIEKGRLNVDRINDESYIRRVQMRLDSMIRN